VPEGDTIHRVAAALRAALAGKELTAFTADRVRGRRPALGTTVERVEARGKHLLVSFAAGVVLHTHLRMNGAWHLYRDGERWRKPAWQARVVIAVDGFEAVCFGAPVVELQRAAAPIAGTAALGPDLCRADADLDECVERMDRLRDPASSIADALLDQRVACGVGNVYKSEVLWTCGVDPFRPVGQIDVHTRRELVATAARLLQSNLDRSGRVTAPGTRGGVAVYGRTGRPCPRCGTRISSRRQGTHARVTYWCPSCQPPA
jgi:endonuclease VIII